MFMITSGCVTKEWIHSPPLHNLKSIPVSGDPEHQVYRRYVADPSLLVQAACMNQRQVQDSPQVSQKAWK